MEKEEVHPNDNPVTHVKGTIDGAVFDICYSSNIEWNRCLIIHCHGYRPEGTGLQADIDHDEYCFRTLLKNGWMVGMTSYRREGLIVRDAIEDVHNLRHYVVCKFGIPYMCILEGRSMGGAIVANIAELDYVSSMYQGALAIGAALLVKELENPIILQNKPQIPILFLTNISELGPVQAYIDASRKNTADDDRLVIPALWEVSREGHNWVNEEERYDAVDNLIQWIHYGTFITRREWNNTVIKKPQSLIKWEYGQSDKDPIYGKGTIISVDVHGAFVTDWTELDLNKIGIKILSKFKTRLGEIEREVVFGCHPFVGISEGSWVCFEDPEGHIMFAKLTFRFNNSLNELGLKVGDEIQIFPPPQVKRISKFRNLTSLPKHTD